ncbi:MAG: alanine racemase [Muribaculaceae bacterium]|nr:alanine racemase [Muribaculaceae bacterium]
MNSRSLKTDDILEILESSGLLVKRPATAEDSEIRHITIDSRSCPPDSPALFAAIRTDVNDGHLYIGEMYGKGVRTFLVERIPEEDYPEAAFICVSSVRDALGTIASSLPVRTDGRRIIITGSYGKSAVKEILYRALREEGADIWRSPRSFNSYIGAVLSSFEEYFSGDHDIAVYEAGIDGPGQAASLVGPSASGKPVLRADTGILTPVNGEHDENFDSHRDKILEKIELLKGCSRIVYDTSDETVTELMNEKFGDSDAVELIPVCGDSPFRALAEAAVPGLDASRVGQPAMRMSIDHGVDGCVLMIDRFTPDLRSLRYALDRLHRHASPGRPKALVLGELLPDYGVSRDEAYAEARRLAGLHGIDRIIEPGSESSRDNHEFGGYHMLVFGDRTPALDCFVESLQRADHDTSLEVDLDALTHNYDYYRHLLPAGTGMVAMVKASAYGMGAIEIGKTLQSRNAAYLAVAVVDEGVAMRDAGITMPIMVLNPVTNRYPALFANRLEPAVFSAGELTRLMDEVRKAGTRNYPIHIKLDTGMHRVGFTASQLDELTELLANQNLVSVKSVFSHLATADCLNLDGYTQSQLQTFYRACERLESRLGHKFLRHILNTAGMMRFADCGPYEMARLGIGLYGISPLPSPDSHLRPVATLRSVIISLKHWPAGTPIGYGCKGMTHRPSVIATVPVGYADGLDRHLGNGAARFLIRGVECPTIGNICMDQCMVDVTDAEGVTVGDRVIIFGPGKPVERLSDTLGTIPYEILTSVSPRVHRTYITK